MARTVECGACYSHSEADCESCKWDIRIALMFLWRNLEQAAALCLAFELNDTDVFGEPVHDWHPGCGKSAL